MRRRTGLLFVAPALALFAVFVLYPMVTAFSYAFFQWQGTTRGAFAGVANFETLFTKAPFTTDLPRALLHNVLFFVGTMLIQNTFGLTIAFLLYSRPRSRRMLQTLYAMPYLVSPIVIGYLWTLLLSPTFGPVNTLLTKIGLESWALPWLGDPKTALWVVILVSVWQWIGFPVLLYGAALGGVPEELTEAARVDGATQPSGVLQDHPAAARAGHRHRLGADVHLRDGGLRPALRVRWVDRKPCGRNGLRLAALLPHAPSTRGRPTPSAARRRSRRCSSSSSSAAPTPPRPCCAATSGGSPHDHGRRHHRGAAASRPSPPSAPRAADGAPAGQPSRRRRRRERAPLGVCRPGARAVAAHGEQLLPHQRRPHHRPARAARSPESTASYVEAWTTGNFATYFGNSLLVTVGAVAMSTAVATMAAYALARGRSRFFRWLESLFLSGLMLPIHLAILPIFYLFDGLGLIDSRLGLVLMYAASGIPFSIFVLTTFFRQLPEELEEAAALDGATSWQTFWRIMVPLVRPALATVAVFRFVPIWNDFLFPLVLLRKRGEVHPARRADDLLRRERDELLRRLRRARHHDDPAHRALPRRHQADRGGLDRRHGEVIGSLA